MLKTDPAVFAVGRNYQIMVPVTGESLFWVRIGDTCYYDESNGIMRSLAGVHRVIVPMAVLDAVGAYTVCEKELIERKPYFPTSRETVETTYRFCPVTAEHPRVYHIADAHNRVEEPVQAALHFGKIDFLILNGDLPNHSGSIENFDTIFEIAARITHGSIPTVFARGNHDLRGFYAEKIADYIPSEKGNTYYTFRLGSIWGIVLDCGEDKDDSHPEYGFTVSCHAFRRRQTDFIRTVIARAAEEYEAPGVSCRLVVVHNPFVHRLEPPFDIEQELFGQWAQLLREAVRPDLMISGHLHSLEIHEPEDGWSTNGAVCPVVVGADPDIGEHFAGAGITVEPEQFQIVFNDSDGNLLRRAAIRRGNQ